MKIRNLYKPRTENILYSILFYFTELARKYVLDYIYIEQQVTTPIMSIEYLYILIYVLPRSNAV